MAVVHGLSRGPVSSSRPYQRVSVPRSPVLEGPPALSGAGLDCGGIARRGRGTV